MWTALKLMLLKDFRTLVRSKWYIIVVEIVLTLLFIPVVWYNFGTSDSNLDKQKSIDENSAIDNFIKNTSSNQYYYNDNRRIYIRNDNKYDLSMLIHPIQDICNSTISIINQVDINNNYNIYQYIDIKKFDLNKKVFDYSSVYLEYDVNDVETHTRFYPNTYGSDSMYYYDYQSHPERIQYCLNIVFMNITNSLKIPIPTKPEDLKFTLIPPPVYYDTDRNAMFNAWAAILPIISLIPVVFSIKEIAREKENGIHTYMIVMGLKRYIYYLSHLIFATVKLWIFLLPAGLSILVFVHDSYLYFINLIIFGQVLIAWMLLSTTIFVSGTYAMILTFFILGGFIGIHYGAVAPNAPIEIPGTAAVASLFNPFTSLMFMHDHTKLYLSYDDVSFNFASGLPYYLPAIITLVFSIIQAIFYTLLAFYLDYVLPIDSSPKSHPLFIFGCGKKEAELHDTDIENIDQVKGRFSEFFEQEMPRSIADVEIKNLIKKWPNGELAVKDVSFKAFRGQVTALLGHNGAGKSTIFGCLTGFLKQTSGDIKMGNGDEMIGYCPQWDPLFPALTVDEHLRFYGTLKTGNPVSDEEVDHVLQQIDLAYARGYRGMNLSGGMKRKLCVGMAMIGQSRVLLLDEPTAGMDPISRKGVLDIVEQIKKDKSIILTTHYMDEADMLSDRIIIMAKGELICNGSSAFLKKKFGVGFVLTIAFNFSEDNSHGYEKLAHQIESIADRHCPGSKIDGVVATQFKIILPNGTQRKFVELFSELENRKNELKINTFGIGVNNLEQVFIKVTDFADPEADSHTQENVNQFLKLRTNRAEGVPLVLQQIKSLIIRKFHYVRRHYIKSLLPLLIIIPLLGLCIDATVSKSTGDGNGGKTKSLSLDINSFQKHVVLIAGDDPHTKALMSLSNEWDNVDLKKIDLDDNTRSALFYYYKKLPALGYGISSDNGIINIYFRDVFENGLSLGVEMITNAIKDDTVKITTAIEYQERHYSDDGNSNDFTKGILYILMAIMSSITFPIIFSPIIYIYISERHTGTLHLYRLTKMSQVIYWFVAYLTDIIVSAVWIICIVALLFGFGIFTSSCLFGYIVGVCGVSFALISQAYFITFIFSNANTALAVLTVYNVIISLVLFGLEQVIGNEMRPTYDAVTDALFPMKSLLQIILTMVRWCLSNKQLGLVGDSDDASQSLNDYPRPERLFQTCTKIDLRPGDPGYDKPANEQYVFCSGLAIYSSFVFGLIYIGLLTIMTLFRTISMKLNAKPFKYSAKSQDDDVIAEETKVDKTSHTDYAITTKHLRKAYKNGVLAVQDLTLGIPKSECFGLLGVNGAGKSTTFHMLTGKLRPSAGIGYVGKIRIDGQAKFGFCPQFDVVLRDLTVLETMNLFSDLNGLKHREECVNLILNSLQMTHRKSNLVKKCSGGEKRRLSIAVALITNCDVIMLDEPTAGVDPRTRRHVWDILIAMRHVGTSQILSSHSMEECEALCTRIGFLNKGALLGIGTSQHLKNKFGNNYMLTLTVANQNDELFKKLNDAVQSEFNGTPMLTGIRTSTLSWTVPKPQDAKWSYVYHHLLYFVDRFNSSSGLVEIVDFALIESSLEQVFITLSR